MGMSIVTKQNKPNRPYHIEEYNPDWVKQFETQKAKLQSILGDEAIRIEHMGSTAVPGLAAKPQIDVLVEVRNLEAIPSFYDAMEATGYEPKGDYTMTGEEYFTLDDASSVRLASVHIYPSHHPEVAFQINFRDYLKSHPDEVNNYGALKLSLQKQFPDDYKAYGEGKELYISSLRKRVQAWSTERN